MSFLQQDHSALYAMPAPPDWPPDLWALLLADARMADQGGWLAVAADCGWSALDVWGVGRWGASQRFDLMGLIPMLRGDQISIIGANCASLKTASGAVNIFKRDMPRSDPRVLVWEYRRQDAGYHQATAAHCDATNIWHSSSGKASAQRTNGNRRSNSKPNAR